MARRHRGRKSGTHRVANQVDLPLVEVIEEPDHLVHHDCTVAAQRLGCAAPAETLQVHGDHLVAAGEAGPEVIHLFQPPSKSMQEEDWDATPTGPVVQRIVPVAQNRIDKRRLLRARGRSGQQTDGNKERRTHNGPEAVWRLPNGSRLSLRRAEKRVVIQYPTRAASFKRLLGGTLVAEARTSR